jgi:hypothetical protein
VPQRPTKVLALLTFVGILSVAAPQASNHNSGFEKATIDSAIETDMAAKKTKASKATKKPTTKVAKAKNKVGKAAAKKSSPAKKASAAATSKPTTTRPAAAKRSAAKATTRRTSAKRSAVRTAKPKSAKAPKSVDGILKSFDKERVTQQTQLTSLQKQIKTLTAKIKSSETQLSKLQKRNIDTQHAIATLDARRDAEIGKLLSSMGINLDSAATAAEAAKKKKIDKPTPLFDQALNKSQAKPGAKKKAVKVPPENKPAGESVSADSSMADS